MSPDEALATLERIRAEIRAANPDMTEEDWDAFADQLAEDVDDGIRRRLRE
jgi:hypothetical protein